MGALVSELEDEPRVAVILEEWRKWAACFAGQTSGPRLLDTELRAVLQRKVEALEAQLKTVTEQLDARVKDEDVPELFAAGQRARALEDDLSAWREWACLRSGVTYMGEADSWLRVRVQHLLRAREPNAVMPKEWGAVEPLSGKEIFAIRHDLMKRGVLP